MNSKPQFYFLNGKFFKKDLAGMRGAFEMINNTNIFITYTYKHAI